LKKAENHNDRVALIIKARDDAFLKFLQKKIEIF